MTRMPDWLQEKLFERRMVLVTGRLDEALASQAAAQIMTLDATGDEPIEVMVDSGEGTLEAAFVLIDVIDAARATVRLQCRGRVEGPAVGVVAAGDERSASSHTVFRLIAPSVAASGTAEQMVAQSEAHRALLWRFQARVARATGRPVEDVAEDMRKGRYLEAQEAVDYRLIDTIT
ncbi:MAG TPA: ATP-dependent Clp protease proteolytic subunit [Methylomirabilota bacterium]|nr:ATP-dependent Clp protease proteolytic subunit [Methylomirabilota bacterium]